MKRKVKKFSVPNIKNKRGLTLITLSISLVGFISFFALVADLGNIFLTKSQLQNAGDAAALAAVSQVNLNETNARQNALDFANQHFAAGQNVSVVAEDVVFGNYDFDTGTYTPNTSPFNTASVYVRRDESSSAGPLNLFFAPLFGKNTSNVTAVAHAVLDPHINGVNGKNRLIPYVVKDTIVDADGDGLFDIGATVDIHPKDVDAEGNFGFLDFDGGSNDIGELRDYIENGYDQDFIIPPGGSIEVLGSTGITGNSLLNSFDVIIDEIVFLPVHDWVVDPGSNATFNVINILAVRVDSVKLNGSAHSRYIRVEIVNFASSVLATDPGAPANTSVAKPRLIAL